MYTTERCFSIVEILSKNIDGYTNNDIAKIIKVAPPTSFRDLNILLKIGIARRSPSDSKKWVLTQKIPRISNTINHAIYERECELENIKQKLTKTN